MKPFGWAFPALVSTLVVVSAAGMWARPRYGGTLRFETAATLSAIGNLARLADAHGDELRTDVLPLVFESMVAADPATGALRPVLAASWHSDPQGRRWQFRLRAGVKLHDGAPLTAAHVAAALRDADPAWKVAETADGVTIECEVSTPDLAWQLAGPRFAVAASGADGAPLGTGPFRIEGFEPNRRLTLAANDAHWGGRPYLDRVVIEMGRASRAQADSLELGRADIVSVLPQEARRLAQRGIRVVASRPRTLVAVVFEPNAAFGRNDGARAAVAAAVDRASICNVLLQREAIAAWSMLPDWISGYATVFSPRFDRTDATSRAAALPPHLRAPTLAFAAGDPLTQAVAERVAVDLRESGFVPRVEARGAGVTARPDMRLVRAAVDGDSAGRALLRLLTAAAGLQDIAGFDLRTASVSTEEAYRIEQAVLDANLVVPIAHVPVLYGVAARVQPPPALLLRPAGELGLADLWLRPPAGAERDQGEKR